MAPSATKRTPTLKKRRPSPPSPPLTAAPCPPCQTNHGSPLRPPISGSVSAIGEMGAMEAHPSAQSVPPLVGGSISTISDCCCLALGD